MSYSDIGYNNFLSRGVTSDSTVMTPEMAETMIAPSAISTMHIGKNIIRADQVQVGLKSWSSNVVWSNSTLGQINWTSHTLVLADSTSISIPSGSYSTVDTVSKFYIYYENGDDEYQVTNDYATVQSDNRILVCSFKLDSSNKMLISPINNDGTLITANSITTGTLSSNNGLTYFDLVNNVIVMNDGSNDRVVIGYQP